MWFNYLCKRKGHFQPNCVNKSMRLISNNVFVSACTEDYYIIPCVQLSLRVVSLY